MPRLPPSPTLAWSDQGVPRASAFDDVYFSREGGLAESDAVFLAGCGLPEAWRDKDRFRICELGFGSGLNVLAAWRAWRRTRKPHAYLHIYSIEAFPLAKADAARALAAFPEVADLSAALLARWPVRAFAPQRLWFDDDGFALTLLTGEAAQVLSQMEGTFDAWFLDGFAPARNDAMWSEEIFRDVARLSAPGARVATFTVAGHVRRGLERVGFAIERKPGFGSKRERLEATLGPAAPSSATPVLAGEGAGGPRRRVAVIGAGIAGAACAHALAKRHVETVVLDEALALGAGASGNPVGLVMPRLDRGGALSEVFLAAYLDAVATYVRLGVLNACGVEERAEMRRAGALRDLLNDPPLPEDWFRPEGESALHVRAGTVPPVRAIEALLGETPVQFEAGVTALERADDGWILRAEDGRAMLKADAVVLACGAALRAFEPAGFLPIALSRGQIEWGKGPPPAHAITRGSYVAPFDGGVLFGATFDALESTSGLAGEAPAARADRARNLEALAKLAPEIAAGVEVSALASRASLRATTPDRAPILGALTDAQAWLAANAGVAHGAAPVSDPTLPGIYVIGGLGARGLTLAPLLGEEIASKICGDPPLLSKNARAAINPARFLHRALKRN
ncbi:FAD-dependent 5-carboxymethylaminomethyl-2-thiouridine(34) oxidoreductase MnmC [Terricaulis sp.]|uniref:FAD-dependent 5-carboxymethylaminomethyl-2-thiouridine(34) oxidoreductase MnmC n=1 Tax=Terricaulis sp. TaxID=2768686 RepID=UPI00378443F7